MINEKGQVNAKLVALIIGIVVFIIVLGIIANPAWREKLKGLGGFKYNDTSNSVDVVVPDYISTLDVGEPSGYTLDGNKYNSSKIMKVLDANGGDTGFSLLGEVVYYNKYEGDIGRVILRKIGLDPYARNSLSQDVQVMFDKLQKAQIGPDLPSGNIVVYLYKSVDQKPLETNWFNLFADYMDEDIAALCFMESINSATEKFGGSEAALSARLVEGGLLSADEAAELIAASKKPLIIAEGTKVTGLSAIVEGGKKVTFDAAEITHFPSSGVYNVVTTSAKTAGGAKVIGMIDSAGKVSPVSGEILKALPSGTQFAKSDRVLSATFSAGKIADGAEVSMGGKVVGTFKDGVLQSDSLVYRLGNKLILIAKGTKLYQKLVPKVALGLKAVSYLAKNPVTKWTVGGYGLVCDAYTITKALAVGADTYAAISTAQSSVDQNDYGFVLQLSKLRNKISVVEGLIRDLEGLGATGDSVIDEKVKSLRAGIDAAQKEAVLLSGEFTRYKENEDRVSEGGVVVQITPGESANLIQGYNNINAQLGEMGKVATFLWNYLYNSEEGLTFDIEEAPLVDFSAIPKPIFIINSPLIKGEGIEMNIPIIKDGKTISLYFKPKVVHVPEQNDIIIGYSLTVNIPKKWWFDGSLDIGKVVESQNNLDVQKKTNTKYYVIDIDNSQVEKISQEIKDIVLQNEIKGQVESLRKSEIRGTNIYSLEGKNE